MAICPNCGVELAEGSSSCPLCRAPVHERAEEAHSGGAYPQTASDSEDFDDFSPSQKKKVFLEVFSICSLIAVLVVAAIDFILTRGLGWSVFPLITLGLTWLCVCVPFFLEGRPWLVFSVLGPALMLYVFLVDVFDGGGLSWFLTFGGPITALAEGVVVGSAALAGASKRKGLNIIALALSAVAVFITGIEAVVNLNLEGRFYLSWSAVVDTAVVPVAGFLFYLHFRITKRASLRKLFHL